MHHCQGSWLRIGPGGCQTVTSSASSCWSRQRSACVPVFSPGFQRNAGARSCNEVPPAKQRTMHDAPAKVVVALY